MAKFKVVMTFPDGEVIDSYEEDGDDGIFDTEQQVTAMWYWKWQQTIFMNGWVIIAQVARFSIFQTLAITLLKWSNKNQITR